MQGSVGGARLDVGSNDVTAMLTGARAGLSALCLIVGGWSSCRSAEPSFDRLLSRARAQAAEGHRFAPAGNNVAETVLTLYKLIAVATPRQRDELSTLLDSEDLIQTSLRKEAAAIELGPVADMTSIIVRQGLDSVPAKPGVPPVEAASSTLRSRASPNGEKSDRRAVSLFTRGETAESRGDISGARRFYAGAAQLGHAVAALQLGRLYDPIYVANAAIAWLSTEPAATERWYARARALGQPPPIALLQDLTAR